MSMDSATVLLLVKLTLVLGLVLLNGFFVAAEFSLVKIRDTQLDTLVNAGSKRAVMARKVISNLDAVLSATQLGITLASLALGWIAEPVFESLLHPVLEIANIESESVRHSISATFGFLVITFLHIVAGELAPKTMAIQYPIPTSLWVAQPLMWFYKASYPFIWMLNHASAWLLRRIGIEPVSEGELEHSEEELKLLISSRGGAEEKSSLGREIVLNSFDLRQRIAREVMRPRREIVFLKASETIDACRAVASESRYSRYPICEEGDLDRTLGVIHFKDLFAASAEVSTVGELRPDFRRIIYVPETSRLDKLLSRFLDKRLHFAIVVDEFGSTVGVVTLENILEELVGEIEDEFYHHEKPLITQVHERQWVIDGLLPLHELSEVVGQSIMEEGVSTVGGWVTQEKEGIPAVGDMVNLGAFVLEVTHVDGPRADKLVLHLLPEGGRGNENEST